MLTSKSSLWKFVSNLFVSIDQLGNAIAGGNPDNTVSARVGYYNHYYVPYESKGVPWYWRWFENIIDFTFYPVDGWNHCHEAYHNDASEIFDNRVTNFLIAIGAGVIIIPSCFLIAIILYTLYLFRIVRPRIIDRELNLHRRLNTSINGLINSDREIDEYGLDFDLTRVKKDVAELKKLVVIIEGKLNSD